MNSKTAIVFGSTGLIGNLLVEELIKSDKYSTIKSFVRQPTSITEPKVEEIVSDFSNTTAFSQLISGDDIFICLGTTIKKAGSVANMEKIDRDLPLDIAKAAASAGVKGIAIVSSIGASARASNYYLRIKGELEDGIMQLPFDRKAILRPSMLLGERKEKRTGEIVGKVVMTAVKPVLIGKLLKYRAIHGRDVAKAMIAVMNTPQKKSVFESDELQKLAAL
jgi:uncharacterized protein YbjT (DUF2867 family)